MEPYRVAVVGLGYVGLPLAIFCAKKGMDVTGVDIDSGKVQAINQGRSPIEEPYIQDAFTQGLRIRATTQALQVKDANTYLVAVPTDTYGPLLKAITTIGSQVRKDALVVVESTVEPGTCEQRVIAALQAELDKRQSSYVVGRDVYLAHCPERINPGDKKYTVENIPRVVGATSSAGLERAVSFYSALLGRENVHPVSSIATAELSKVVENSFRGYNIAFANALAIVCERAGLDFLELMGAAGTKPFAFLAHYASRGWGGHCIPKDTKFLERFADSLGIPMRLLKAAIEQNEQMPIHTVDRIAEALNEARLPLNGSNVAVLGLAYKPDIDDTRETPAVPIVRELSRRKALVRVFDPFVPEGKIPLEAAYARSREEAVKGSDAVLVCTAHTLLTDGLIDLIQKEGVKVLVDGQNALGLDPKKTSFVYKGIGR